MSVSSGVGQGCYIIENERINDRTLAQLLLIHNQEFFNLVLHSTTEPSKYPHIALLESHKWINNCNRILFYRHIYAEDTLPDTPKYRNFEKSILKTDTTHMIVSVITGFELLVFIKKSSTLETDIVDESLKELCLALRSDKKLDDNKTLIETLNQLKIEAVYSNLTNPPEEKDMAGVYQRIRQSNASDPQPILYRLRPIHCIYRNCPIIFYNVNYATFEDDQYKLLTLHQLYEKADLFYNHKIKPQLKKEYDTIKKTLAVLCAEIQRGEKHELELIHYFRNNSCSLWTDLEKLVSKNRSNSSSNSQGLAELQHRDVSTETSLSLDLRSSSPSLTTNINILLIGETGVGKSTFINALANHMHFTSLKQAQQSDPVILISSSFIITRRPQFHEITINIGTPDSNENNNNRGESVTQRCKSYPITIDNYPLLTIVDTPGVGDTRGVKQDDININNIHSFMEQLDHINAICFLMKPNVERLHPSFRLCLTQLLNMVDSNARKNIVFCFTNTRATFYAPGNTGVLLNDLLDKLPGERISFENANTFCFDSESFRYLAATKQDIEFDEKEKRDYKASWSKSVDETKRFLEYIKSLDKIILQKNTQTSTEAFLNEETLSNVF